MSFLSFLARRFLTGTVAKGATNHLTKRFNLSPAIASITLIVLTEMLARGFENPKGFIPGARGKK